MGDDDFSKLLQQAEQLTTEIEGNEDLPRVERSLGQVLEASHELYSRVIQSGSNDVQAHLLFGSKGIDLQQISQKLETLSSKRTFEPLQPIADSDIESFLKNERENAILSLIDEVNKNSLQTTEDQKWEHMLSEWNREKIKLMNAMIGPSQNWLDLKRAPEPPSIADTPKKFGHSMLDNIEAAYARQVHQYNKLVFQGAKSKTALHQKFSQVAEEFNDPKVKEMWEIIKTMANIPALVRDEDPLKARGNPAIQQCLITQGKKYLEKRYKQYMSDFVRTNPAAAMRGGEPGTYPLVRGFVGLRLQGQSVQGLTDGVIDERPLWPMVYYCLRSGDPNAALHCLRKAGRDHEEFVAALEEYMRSPEKPLSDKLQTAINFQYRIQVRNSTDPYKRAVYCVVGCCDASDEHGEVARAADDYLWLKLALIRSRPSPDRDAFTYSDLQKLILEEYGETHYHAYEKPLVYFQVLTLTGQFEPAIEFLSRIPRFQVHGVHMALALHDVFMLGTPRNVQAPLLSVDTDDPAPLRRLNLARLLLLYVRKFELSDPSDALHYYFFLRNLKDPSGKNLFMCCCTDLALESRDYDLLFGRMDANTGLRSSGLLDQFNNPQIDSKVIALNVAEQLVNKGLFEDAITMYDIAGNMEKVLELFCVLLAQVVNSGGGAGGLRARLAALGEHVARRLRAAPPAPAALHDAYTKLCKLMTFFDQYHAGNYEGALETLRECALVPLSADELEERVSAARCARGELLRALPAVLRAVCAILLAQRQALRAQPNAKVIALNVAEQLVNKGLFEDAITMYDIAGNMEKVLELFCVLLAQVVNSGGGAGGLRARLAALGEHVARRLRAAPPAPAALHDAYTKLCKLMTFFDQYHAGNYEGALETLRECALVPLSADELEERVSAARCARGELLRALPAVLRAVCAILLAQRQALRAQPNAKVIALNVAEQLVNKGLFEDAITMYDIAGNMEKVLELFCVLLAQVVNSGGGAGGLRARLAALGEHVARRLRAAPPAPAALHDAYTKLCKLMTFFDQYHAGNYEGALETLRECALVPLSADELEERVSAARCARGELLRALPAVLRAVCAILLAQRQALRAQPNAKQIEWLREQAEVLNTFAGNISYRMPGDTYSQLVQLQILMI